MSETTLDAKALEAYIPHRGANILADTVTMNAARTHAVSRPRVLPGDARGREIFGRRGPDGVACWYEPFLAELMALTGVPLLRDKLAPLGHVAVFSMISKIVFDRLAPLAGEVVGEAVITRDRGAFTVFSTKATIDGQRILEAEVMSGSAALADIAGGPGGEPGDLPAGTAPAAAALAWKPEATRFAHTVISADAASGKLVTGYRYPVGHPFVPGHFPGAPLMMGVTQWAAVADAAWLAAQTFGYPGVIAQGTIRRPSGAEILDVRDLDLITEGGLPRIAGTKRIAFRDKVMPGDAVLVEVTVVPR